jgi:hypothetical protein
LEATSIGFSIETNMVAMDFWKKNQQTVELLQEEYSRRISDISAMISLHYLAGSKYDTAFWKYAKSKAIDKITKEFKNNTAWSKFVWSVILDKKDKKDLERTYGSWGDWNYKINIEGLGIKDEIIKIRNSTKSMSLNKEGK